MSIEAFRLTGRIEINFGRSREDLKTLEKQTVGVATRLKGLGSSVREALSSAGGEMKNFGLNWTQSVTAPLALAAGTALKFAGDLEQAVANISTIKPEIDTSQVFKALEDISTRVPQSAEVLAAGLYNIFSSVEVSQADALRLVEQFAKGATAAQTDASTFGTAVIGVMNAYKLSVADAGHISDVFFKTVQLGVVNGEELASQLGEVTQAAKNAGVNFDTLGGLIAGVTKEGGSASTNINNLSNFLQKLPTKEAKKGFADLGVAVADASGNFRPVVDILGDLKRKLDELNPEARAEAIQKIFPDAQARTGVQTLLSQLNFVRDAAIQMSASAGTADGAFAKMSATFNSNMTRLKNVGLKALTEIGAKLLPIITPMAEGFISRVGPAIDAVSRAFEAMGPGVTVGVVAFSAVVAAIGPVAIALGGLMAAVAAIGAPIVAAAVVVTGAVSAMAAAYATNFLGIRDVTNSVITEVSNFVRENMGIVIDWWRENLPIIKQTVENVLNAVRIFWRDHGEHITTVVSTMWSNVKTVIQTGLKFILNNIKLVMQIINGDWRGAWDTFKSSVIIAVSGALKVLQGMDKIVVTILKGVGQAMLVLADELYKIPFKLGTYIISGLVAGIESGTSRVVNALTSVAKKGFAAFNGALRIQSPSKAFYESGTYIVEGLRNGINDGRAAVQEDIEGLVSPPGTKGAPQRNPATGRFITATQAAALAAGEFADSVKNSASKIDSLMGALGQIAGMIPGQQVGKKRGFLSKALGFAAPFLNFIPGVGPILSQIARIGSSAIGGDYGGALMGAISGFSSGGAFRRSGSAAAALPTGTFNVNSIATPNGVRVDGARAMGGPVSRGRAYLVGENRPEVFTPNADGWIHPDASRYGGGGGRGGSGSGTDSATLASLLRVIGSLEQKIVSMRPGDVVGVGSRENPHAIGAANQRAMELDPKRVEWMQRRVNGG
jgi:TP901 family phage tail tape measure protein